MCKYYIFSVNVKFLPTPGPCYLIIQAQDSIRNKDARDVYVKIKALIHILSSSTSKSVQHILLRSAWVTVKGLGSAHCSDMLFGKCLISNAWKTGEK